ncbi:MAG: hypothetical protein ACRDGF_00930 [Chloroflexota bacterium]
MKPLLIVAGVVLVLVIIGALGRAGSGSAQAPPATAAAVSSSESPRLRPTAAPSQALAKPITFDGTDFKGGFRSDQFVIAVRLTNHDGASHKVQAQANFYDVMPAQLGADPASHLVTAGTAALMLAAHQTDSVLIHARNVGGATIEAVGFTATCEDGPLSTYCAQAFAPITGH